VVAGTRASTIVIVEESAALQELLEQALRAEGDCVLVTGNPLEVLDVARRIRIDVLVAHIESSGELFEEIQALQPDLRVLYVVDESDDLPTGPDSVAALRTPFSLRELRAAITELLDRSGAPG
jgi:DNA-binding response OmpR family regulator